MKAVRVCLAATALFAGINDAAGDTYDVRVDDALTNLVVTVCVDTGTAALTARDPAARHYLRTVVSLPERQALAVNAAGITLDGRAQCVEYTVDIGAMTPDSRRYGQLAANNRALPIAQWLWRSAAARQHPTEVTFTLPQAMQVSVPWQPLPPLRAATLRFRIPASPESDDAISALGYFARCDIAVAGATLRTAVLSGRHTKTRAHLFDWLAHAAGNVTLVYGRLPNPAPQILVIPVAGRQQDPGEPVPFGHVIRDGGEAVQFYVNETQSLARFVNDWTATHEFAHLLLPYINADENWISEGLASYYQNVLLARGGVYSADKAWRKIIEGFGRGEKAVPHLSLEQAMPRGSWDGIMKTYWGGAAVFLMADVALRTYSNNTASLDTVLDQFQRCCLPSGKSWRGDAFFRKLDALAPVAVFSDLYTRHRDAIAFPDTGPVLHQLGVSLHGSDIELAPHAPLAAIRQSIMAPRVRTPVLTDHCAAP